MNAERQIIGSLLLDQSRIDEMSLINSEMFTDPILSEIFSLYEHADGKEINQLVIVSRIRSDYMTEQQATKFLAEIVAGHDGGVSDRCSMEAIYDSYRTRKFDEIVSKMQLDPRHIDRTLEDFQSALDGLKKTDDETRPKSLSELTEYKTEYFKPREKKRFFVGFDKIDSAIGGLDGGDIIIIAARPGIGKSAYALQMIRKFGRDGFKVGYFNLEMSEKQIYERSIAAASGIDMTRIRLANNFLNDEGAKFEKGNEILAKEDNVFTITGTQTVSSIRAAVKREGYQVIVIDYLQLIQSISKRNNRASEVGDISRGIKGIATEFNIPVIALSQLNRASEMNKDKEPTMSELRESGDIEQDASVILMLWNPNVDDPSEKMIKIEKSRNGFTDRMKLYFDGKHMTFSSIDVNEGFRESREDDLPWN